MMPATCVPKKRLASIRVPCQRWCYPFCQAALISLLCFEIFLKTGHNDNETFFQGQHYLHVWSAGSCRRSLHVRFKKEMEQHQFCCCHFPSSYVVVVCWLVIIWKNFSSDLISLQDPLLRLQVCSERPDGGALHWAKTGKLKQREACIFVKSSQKNDAIARSLLKIMSYFRLTLEIECTWCWSAPLS